MKKNNPRSAAPSPKAASPKQIMNAGRSQALTGGTRPVRVPQSSSRRTSKSL